MNAQTPPSSIEAFTTEEQRKEKKIAVIETFGPTIQGEGPLAGSKTMFVRFGGCDYRCNSCDSLHAVIPAAIKKHASYLTAKEIADAIIPKAKETGTPWVTLSGGNPCMWDLTELCTILLANDIGIAVETQGTLAPDWLAMCQMIVVSPKSPGMGEKFEHKKFTDFLHKLNQAWEVRQIKHKVPAGAIALKVVIFSQQDIDFAVEVGALAYSKQVHPGLLFLSLGNDSPPKLDGEYELVINPNTTLEQHKLNLLESYRILIDDVVNDPRCTHFKFLPQLHVLAYGNEAER